MLFPNRDPEKRFPDNMVEGLICLQDESLISGGIFIKQNLNFSETRTFFNCRPNEFSMDILTLFLKGIRSVTTEIALSH